jgi:hypothetical protein
LNHNTEDKKTKGKKASQGFLAGLGNITLLSHSFPGYLNHPVDILGFSMQILSEVGSVY